MTFNLQEAGIEALTDQDAPIDPDYVIKVVDFVAKLTRKELANDKQASASRRQQHFSNEHWGHYRKEVKDLYQKEQTMKQKIFTLALECLSVDSNKFESKRGELVFNMQYSPLVMQAQDGKIGY